MAVKQKSAAKKSRVNLEDAIIPASRLHLQLENPRHEPIESEAEAIARGSRRPDVFESAVGHCGDNAAYVGFFGVLERERICRMKYPILDAARVDVFQFIERFHNSRMRTKVARE